MLGVIEESKHVTDCFRTCWRKVLAPNGFWQVCKHETCLGNYSIMSQSCLRSRFLAGMGNFWSLHGEGFGNVSGRRREGLGTVSVSRRESFPPTDGDYTHADLSMMVDDDDDD